MERITRRQFGDSDFRRADRVQFFIFNDMRIEMADGNFSCFSENGHFTRLFDKNAFCVGPPCEFDADCPSNETCNGAEHACVGN